MRVKDLRREELEEGGEDQRKRLPTLSQLSAFLKDLTIPLNLWSMLTNWILYSF